MKISTKSVEILSLLIYRVEEKLRIAAQGKTKGTNGRVLPLELYDKRTPKAKANLVLEVHYPALLSEAVGRHNTTITLFFDTF